MKKGELIMFNEILRETREEKNISQVQMAKLLGIPVSTYRNYENTSRQPAFDILIKMSAVLGVSIDHLLGNNSREGKYEELLYKIKLLPTDKIDDVNNYIDFLSYKVNKDT